MHPHHPIDEAAQAPLPCAGGLLAATLALMTCWAEPEPTASMGAAQQRLMARRIVSNLYFLREHPHLPCGLRLVITKLHARWCDIAQAPHQRALPTEPASRELH